MKSKFIARRWRELAFFCLFAIGAAYAQNVPYGYVLVSGTNTTDSGGNVVQNGTISFQPANSSGTPTSFRIAGGTGAKATAVFGVTIGSQTPGSGYSGSWTCAVNGGTYSSAATCTATVSSGGLVFAITGAGSYTVAPTSITFSGGTYVAGTPATVTPSMTVSSVTVAAGGSNYQSSIAFFPGCTTAPTGSWVTIVSGAVTAVPYTGGNCPNGTSVVIVSSGQASLRPVTAQVTNGVFSVFLADTVLSTPQNPCYVVTITDNVSGNALLSTGYNCAQPAGSGSAVTGANPWCAAGAGSAGGTCNFDLYVPNVSSLALNQLGLCCFAGVTSNGNNGINVTGSAQFGTGPYYLNLVTTGIAASWSFNGASALGALESIGGHFQVNGSTVSNGVNPVNFTSASMTPPAGNSNCTFYNVGLSVNCYVPTPSSPSSLMAAPGNGYIFNITYNGNATTFPQGTNGDVPTISGCTGAAAGVTANAPIYLKCPSGTTAGTGAAFIGNPVTASNGLPFLYFDYIIPAFTDISSGNNFWGFCHTCTNTNLYVTSAPYAPAFPMAMITASTSAGDSTFYCVTSDGTTVSRTAITGASLPTSGSSYPFQIVGTIAVNASNVICTVNGVSVTKTTNLPGGALYSLAADYVDIPTSTTAVNVGLNKEYAYYQPGGRSN